MIDTAASMRPGRGAAGPARRTVGRSAPRRWANASSARRGRRDVGGCRRPRRRPRRVGHVAGEQLLARPEGLALGLGQRAAALQRRGAVHPADAGEDGEGVLLRPSASWPRSTRRPGRDRRASSQALMRLQYTLPVEYGRAGPRRRTASRRRGGPCPSGTRPGRSGPGRASGGLRLRGPASGAPAERRRPRSASADARSRSPPAVGGLGLAEQQRRRTRRTPGRRRGRAGLGAASRRRSRAGPEAVVLVQPDRALAGPSVVARARRSRGRRRSRASMQSSRRPSHHAASAEHVRAVGLEVGRLDQHPRAAWSCGLPVLALQRRPSAAKP